jgi:EmrB/QacA subfamily drug resistance transporter
MSATANSLPSTATPDSEGNLDRQLVGIAIVFIIGSVMSILDTTIVNVAIKTLSQEFVASVATIQWVSTGYLLALATVIPVTGWAADRFGTKRLYMASLTLFICGSSLSGVAWSADSLIFFRVLQGLGGGMIIPVGMTILTHAAGPRRIGRVMAIVGVPMLLAPILGPVLGGYIVDAISWRWIFFINLPIGAAGLAAAARALAADEPKPLLTLDWRGLLLLSPGVAIFVYGLAEIASGGEIGSGKAVAGVVIGLALVLAFVQHARRRERALIDVRLFTRRDVGASAATTFLFGAAFFGVALLMPLYFQVARGESALEAGLLLAVQGLGAMIAMPIAGRLTDKIGPGKIVLVGLGLTALGMLSLSQITATTPGSQIELTLFVMGLGSGSTMMPAMTAPLGALERDEVARATTALNMVLRLGGSIGTALIAVVLTHQLADLLPSTSGEEISLSAVRSLPASARALIAPQLGAAFGHAFSLPLAIVILAIAAALFLPRKRIERTSDADVIAT